MVLPQNETGSGGEGNDASCETAARQGCALGGTAWFSRSTINGWVSAREGGRDGGRPGGSDVQAAAEAESSGGGQMAPPSSKAPRSPPGPAAQQDKRNMNGIDRK